MIEAVLVGLERRFERKDCVAMLDRHDAPRRERAAVANAVDFVNHRRGRIAGAHEISMQRMDVPVGFHGALRGDQRLGDGLATEDALPALLRAATTIEVVFELLEVENGEKLLHGS